MFPVPCVVRYMKERRHVWTGGTIRLFGMFSAFEIGRWGLYIGACVMVACAGCVIDWLDNFALGASQCSIIPVCRS